MFFWYSVYGDRMKSFIAALDQSGYSVDRTLTLYDVKYDEYNKQNLIDDFKMKVVKSKCFNNDKIFGVIISKDMIHDFPQYLKDKKIFVKIDEGLSDEKNGVRLFKKIDDSVIDSIKGFYGTKIRSLILKDDEKGISEAIKQQFTYAFKIYSKGLIPIIEPEVSIHAENKKECEKLLKKELLKYEDCGIKYILKLTLPEIDNFYSDLFNDNLIHLSFLSGGYSKNESIKKLSKNNGIACFSRVLLDGLKYDQSIEEFENVLSSNIDDIYNAVRGESI